MKYYFTLISNDYRVDKNKLEAAAKKATRKASYRIISEKEILPFKKEFRDKIKKLNEKFPRCKPLEISSDRYHISNTKSYIWIEGVCCLDFYLAKNEI